MNRAMRLNMSKLTLLSIRRTNWYRECVVDLGTEQADYAVKLLLSAEILYINENTETGELAWAVTSDEAPGFWLEAKDTLREAEQFCKSFGKKYEVVYSA